MPCVKWAKALRMGHTRSVFALPRREEAKALRKGLIGVFVISPMHYGLVISERGERGSGAAFKVPRSPARPDSVAKINAVNLPN